MALKITDIGELTTFNLDKNRIIRMTGMDMIIEEGRISEIDESLPDADEKVDASGRLVTPGFVDAGFLPGFFFCSASGRIRASKPFPNLLTDTLEYFLCQSHIISGTG